MNFIEIQKIRTSIINNFSSNINEGIDFVKKKEIILKDLIGFNKFITIYHFNKSRFVFSSNLFEVTGYTDKEFTGEALNNSPNSKLKITSSSDIAHKLRYDLVMYKMLTKGFALSSFEDCYEISFNIIHKNGRPIKVRRSCYIFEVSNESTPISHIDIWEELPTNKPEAITVNLFSKKHSNANTLFYKINSEELDFKLTKRQIQILELKRLRNPNKIVASKLNITEKTIENHISILKNNVNLLVTKNNLDIRASTIHDIIYILELFGLFPIPTEKE